MDTAFVSSFFNGKIAQTLETDSMGFYLAGDLVQFGYQQVNYLVKVHNKRGQIQVANKPALRKSSVRLYLNPTKDLLWISGAPAGASLRFYNVQGQIMFSGPSSKSISTQAWPSGVYFWRMEQQGKWVESGRVVKD